MASAALALVWAGYLVQYDAIAWTEMSRSVDFIDSQAGDIAAYTVAALSLLAGAVLSLIATILLFKGDFILGKYLSSFVLSFYLKSLLSSWRNSSHSYI